MNTVRTSALADPNVTKLFQRRVPALSATLSSDFSSRRFITDILPSDMHCPMAPCYGVQHGWFFHGEYIPEAVQIAI